MKCVTSIVIVTDVVSLQLKSYVEEWFTGRRMTVVGVGVNHDELVKHAEVLFSRVPEGMSTTEEKCGYVGGKDY